MKVRIATGWKSRKTTHVDVHLRDKGCIDITVLSNIPLFPMKGEMNDTLYESLMSIGHDFNFCNPEIDTRDDKTLWLWDREIDS